MPTNTILVTGATGTVGRAAVRLLVEKGARVRALTRDPAKAGNLGEGVTLVTGDLAAPEGLAAAMSGVDQVLAIVAGTPELPRLDRAVVDAAKGAGVRHVVKLSTAGVTRHPDKRIARWHAEGEARLRASGMEWTFVRPGAFASNALNWARSIREQGTIFQAGAAGGLAMIDPVDIAAVAVVVLTAPGHDGKAYELTGPEALTVVDQAKIIGAAIGKEIRVVDASMTIAREAMSRMHMAPELVEALVEMAELRRDGEGTFVTPTVRDVLGREPRTFARWVDDHVAAFR